MDHKQAAQAAVAHSDKLTTAYRAAHRKAEERVRAAADAWAKAECGLEIGDIVERFKDRHDREIWWTERWRVDRICGSIDSWSSRGKVALHAIVLHCTRVKADGTIGKRSGVKMSAEDVRRIDP